MGWKQWALIRVANQSSHDSLKIKFPNTDQIWGWTFKDTQSTNTRDPLPTSDIEKQDIGPKSTYAYGHTGKAMEWAGMSGTIELYTKDAAAASGLGERVCIIYYSCPWGAGGNVFRISDVASQWNVTQWGADYNGDSLGSVTVEVRRM